MTAEPRARLLARGLRLEYLTVGWNLLEGVIAIAAAVAANSLALLGFGVDSFIESASATVLIWRLRSEAHGLPGADVERVERKAERLVGASFILLAAYVGFESVRALILGRRPEAAPVGIALTAISLVVMWWLARAKMRTALELGSDALAADAAQTYACLALSLIVLTGILLNAAFGWWWADPIAALGMTVFLIREGREAWTGDENAPP